MIHQGRVRISTVGLPWHLAVLAIPFLPRRYRWASAGFLTAGLVWHVVAVDRRLAIQYRSTRVPEHLRGILSSSPLPWKDRLRDVTMWDTGRS